MSRRRKSKQQRRGDSPQEIWLAAQVTLPAILGFFLLFFAGNGCLALMRYYTMMATADQYEDRELEILSYRSGPNSSSEDPLRITGILHPEGIEVQTDDHDISLSSLTGSKSMIQMAPAEKEVIGKRIQVRYYMGKPEELRWWAPPRVHTHFLPTDESLQRTQFLTVVSILAVASCFYGSYRANVKYKRITGDSSSNS